MMASSKAKTPTAYIAQLSGERKKEIQTLHAFIKKCVPALKPSMQAGMIGYGTYHYRYATGREGDWPIIALASQKNYISLYVCASDGKQYVAEKYKARLPKANIGKSCIRFKRVSDIDLKVIEKLINESCLVMRTMPTVVR